MVDEKEVDSIKDQSEGRDWEELSSAELEVWKASVELFKSENNLYFSRNNVFLSINGVLLVVASGAFNSYPFINLVISGFGIFLCVMWYRISIVGKHYSAKWANVAKDIEKTWKYRPVDVAAKQSLVKGSPPMKYGKATDNIRYLIIGILLFWMIISSLLIEDGAYRNIFDQKGTEGKNSTYSEPKYK